MDECREIVASDLLKIPAAYRDFDERTRNDRSVNPWRRMVVGIVTCRAHYNRLANFVSVFHDVFDRLGLDYYAVVADGDRGPAQGPDFAVYDGARMFVAKAKESYETLAHKLAIFYAYVYNHTDYDYVIKADDTCLLDLSEVLRNAEADYAGWEIRPTLNFIHFNKCSDPAFNAMPLDFGHGFKEFLPGIDDDLYASLYGVVYAAGGYGYRLSREALRRIDTYKRHVLSLGLSYEDVLFGQILHLEGIDPTPQGIGRYHGIAKD